jgi:trans-aconitate methyltransferase
MPEHIVDLGCGLGFTTDALSKVYPDAKVLGIDISTDADESVIRYTGRVTKNDEKFNQF